MSNSKLITGIKSIYKIIKYIQSQFSSQMVNRKILTERKKAGTKNNLNQYPLLCLRVLS